MGPGYLEGKMWFVPLTDLSAGGELGYGERQRLGAGSSEGKELGQADRVQASGPDSEEENTRLYPTAAENLTRVRSPSVREGPLHPRTCERTWDTNVKCIP